MNDMLRCTRRAALFLLASPALISANAAAPRGVPKPRLDATQMQEDLRFLRDVWAPLDRSFDTLSRQRFNQAIEETLEKAPSSSVQDFALDIMHAVALAGNGHTAVAVGRILGDLPIRIWPFADGLFVVSTHPNYRYLLGARLTRFGALSVDEAFEQAASFISGTAQRRKYLAACYLTMPHLLLRIGAGGDINAIPITFVTADGRQSVVQLGITMETDPSNDHVPIEDGYSALIPGDRELRGRWDHVLDRFVDYPDIYYKPRDLFTRWIGQAHDILYIKSNFIESRDSDPRQTLDRRLLFKVLEDYIVTKKPRFVIVDLRFNNGGDYFLTLLFSQALPRLIPDNGHIFVLAGRATFSAAIVTVAMIKQHGAEKVSILGEEVGDSGRFWSEVGAKTLPNSKITAVYATALQDWEHGCSDKDRCYWPAVAFESVEVSLAPDLQILPTFRDYASARDPVLEAALACAV